MPSASGGCRGGPSPGERRGAIRARRYPMITERIQRVWILGASSASGHPVGARLIGCGGLPSNLSSAPEGAVGGATRDSACHHAASPVPTRDGVNHHT
jgi:hypothetical protein